MNWSLFFSTISAFAAGIAFACFMFKTGQWGYDK